MTRRTRLGTRAAMLGVVLAMLGLTLVYPLRLYAAQRSQINQLAASNEAQRRQVEDLQKTVKRYDDPAWVRDQARLRLHYTLPGEKDYLVAPSMSLPPASSKPASSKPASSKPAPPKPSPSKTAGATPRPTVTGPARGQ
jgi:cell division protein FtsB